MHKKSALFGTKIEFKGVRGADTNFPSSVEPRQYFNMKPEKQKSVERESPRLCVCICVCVRAQTLSIPAFPSTPWLTVKVSVKAPCRICILPTGIIPRVESWTRSRNKRACFVTKRTTLCAISCCQSFFCSSFPVLYHPFSPKAPGR